MKRNPSLHELSSEHHTTLVLARRIRQRLEESGTDTARLWQEVVARFQEELEPHFQKEERGVLLALQARGEGALVERTCREHDVMRALAANGGPDDLARMAQLLTDHVRFEERELFAAAQACLSDAELERWAHLAHAS